MAEWEPFEAGTVISGKEIATRSEEIAYEINNLGASAIPNKALNREHLPAAYDRSRTKSNTETYTVNSHKFTFPGWPSDNLTGAGWDQAPMGAGAGKAWCFDLPGSNIELDIDFSENDGVLLLANAHVTKLIWTYTSKLELFDFTGRKKTKSEGATAGDITPDTSTKWVAGNKTDLIGFFMLVLIDAAGQKYPIPKTLRYIDADTNTGTNQDAKNRGAREIPEGGSFIPENNGCKGLPRVYKDVSIRSYVRQEDLVRANVGMAVPHQFVEVQLVASVLRNHSPVIFGSPGNVYMDVRETRVSGIIPRFATGAVKTYRLHGRY
jgi:hypothetical protein